MNRGEEKPWRPGEPPAGAPHFMYREIYVGHVSRIFTSRIIVEEKRNP